MEPWPGRPEVCKSVDLLAPEGYGEIIGGRRFDDNLEWFVLIFGSVKGDNWIESGGIVFKYPGHAVLNPSNGFMSIFYNDRER